MELIEVIDCYEVIVRYFGFSWGEKNKLIRMKELVYIKIIVCMVNLCVCVGLCIEDIIDNVVKKG